MTNSLSSKTKALNGPNAEAEQKVTIKERINRIVDEVRMYAEGAHPNGYPSAVLEAVLSNPNIQFELGEDTSVDDETLYVNLTAGATNLGTMIIGPNTLSYDIRHPYNNLVNAEAILMVPTFPVVDNTPKNTRRLLPKRNQEPEAQQVVRFVYWIRNHAAGQIITLTEHITREEVKGHPGIYLMNHHTDKRILSPRQEAHDYLSNFIHLIRTYDPNKEI